MNLNNNQRKFLRKKGQQLKPVVWIGQAGLSTAVTAELELALEHHELVKVKVAAGERSARDEIITRMCEQSGAELVQRIGHMALLYRPASDLPRLVLPG